MSDNLVWGVATIDEEKAIKVTNEKRGILVANNLWGNRNKTVEFLGVDINKT